MDPRFQTSFIPKKPIVAATGKTSAPINLFSLIATIFFVGALVLTGGVFFYKQLLIKQIDESKQELESAKAAFEPETVKQLIRLDARLEAGKSLLGTHVAVTPLFDFLSSVTLKSVRFKDFSFTYLAPDKVQVRMKGQAQNYSAVALQSDVLNGEKNLKDTMLTDMTLEPSGTISFNVSTIIDPSLTSYASFISGASVPNAGTEIIETPQE